MRNISLLENKNIENIVRKAGFNSLEDLAVQEAVGGLGAIDGIGEKRAEKIREAFKENGVRYELTGEERLLIFVLWSANKPIEEEKWGQRSLVRHFLDHPMNDEQLEVFNDIISALPEREQKVITLRFGLNGSERMSRRRDVGKELRVTPERIRQIEAKVLRKLRHPKREERLEKLLEMN